MWHVRQLWHVHVAQVGQVFWSKVWDVNVREREAPVVLGNGESVHWLKTLHSTAHSSEGDVGAAIRTASAGAAGCCTTHAYSGWAMWLQMAVRVEQQLGLRVGHLSNW